MRVRATVKRQTFECDYFDAAAEEVNSESSRSIDPSHATALISVGAQALVCSERSESKSNAAEKITSPVVNLALYFVVGALDPLLNSPYHSSLSIVTHRNSVIHSSHLIDKPKSKSKS